MNLCELPFATLSERAGNRKILRFEVDDFDRESNQILKRILTVKGDAEYGLPTGKDEEIYLGLLKYTSDYNGFSQPEVSFSRAELFDLMGWKKTDWAYARLVTGMHRLVGVRLSYQNLWRDNSNKQWRDQGAFGILDSFRFQDRRQAEGVDFREHRSTFCWSAVLFQSFDSGYLKRIDFGLTRQLSVTARRLYRYLDKHFHPPRKTRISMDLRRLAYQHIGVSPNIELDKVRKRYIGPAAEELEQFGYLRSCPHDKRFSRLARGSWEAQFELAVAQRVPAAVADKQFAALRKRGVSESVARELCAKFPQAKLVRAIRAMDQQQRSGAEIRSPDRWMRAAVERGYQPADEPSMSASKRPERRLFRAGKFVD